jgi:hypothetical protein
MYVLQDSHGKPGVDLACNTTEYKCPVGRYCPAGSVTPLLCPVGTYGPSTAATAVTDCQICTDVSIDC